MEACTDIYPDTLVLPVETKTTEVPKDANGVVLPENPLVHAVKESILIDVRACFVAGACVAWVDVSFRKVNVLVCLWH